ncbi:MAG: hypothetical protein WAL10_18150, partial [Acetobacteraceae bacterium]
MTRAAHEQQQQQRRHRGEDHQHVVIDIGDDLRLMIDHLVEHHRALPGRRIEPCTRGAQRLQCAIERIDRGADRLMQRLRVVREQRCGHRHTNCGANIATQAE